MGIKTRNKIRRTTGFCGSTRRSENSSGRFGEFCAGKHISITR